MTGNQMTSDLAPTAGAGAPSLLERLAQRGWEFDFFQAAWLLERYAGGDTPVGQRGPASKETLRFRPDLSLGFPATDVRRVIAQRGTDREALRHLLEVTFLGLYGVSSPLPLHYPVEILRTAEPSVGEETVETAGAAPASSPVRDFLDVFHHRLISLFYRGGLKYRYERLFAVPQRDAVTEYLRCLVGCPPHFDERTLGVAPIRLLRYAGTLTQRPRSATTLAGLLFDYWGDIPIHVRQFVGQWVPLDEADQNRLGARNSGLGTDLTIGEQVYDLGGTFTIAVGPVDWTTYMTFVPGGARFRQTRALTRLYCCDPLGFTIEVTLRPGEVPETRLTCDDTAGALGLTTWVRTRAMGETTVTFDATQDTGVSLGAPPVAARGAA